MGAWTLVAIAAGAVAVGGALLLTAAGLGHLRHRYALPAALHAQRVLPVRLRHPVATAVIGAELVVGASMLVAVLVAPSVIVAPLVAQALVYAAFTGYLGVVLRLRPAAPCGCFGTDEPVTWLVVVRAGLFGGGALGAALLGADVAAMPAAVRLLCLAGGFVVAMAGWLLPVLGPGSGSRGKMVRP
jgi:hypothetical protein